MAFYTFTLTTVGLQKSGIEDRSIDRKVCSEAIWAVLDNASAWFSVNTYLQGTGSCTIYLADNLWAAVHRKALKQPEQDEDRNEVHVVVHRREPWDGFTALL